MDSIQHIADAVIGIAWAIFIIVWLVSAFTAKRTVKHSGTRALLYRLLMAIVIVLILSYDNLAQTAILPFSSDPVIDAIGALLVVLGVALAIWARYHLGRNWGMPMSEKEGAELVTTGPYAYIRNPIYSGMFLAMLGAALAVSAVWALILVFFGSYFIWSILGEEKIMMRLFPDKYPAYKARTKRLIPRVW